MLSVDLTLLEKSRKWFSVVRVKPNSNDSKFFRASLAYFDICLNKNLLICNVSKIE